MRHTAGKRGGMMGGYGSGRWEWHSKKTTVEECTALDAGKLARDGMLIPGKAGVLRWHYVNSGEPAGSVNYYVTAGPVLHLSYILTTGYERSKHEVDMPIWVESVQLLPRGGPRWFFICPLIVNGRVCGRRAGKLYLAPGSRYFGCRHCLDLTYQSAQEHDPRVAALQRDPDALLKLLQDPDKLDWKTLMLAFKALR